MREHIEFETPENVGVAYEAAGLGTRFVAWVIDSILIGVAAVVIFFVLLCAGLFSEKILQSTFEPLNKIKPGDQIHYSMYFIGLATLINGLMSFVYFGFSELLGRGQTIGKRKMGIRVVRADGFALDTGSIFVRNLLRVLDNLPILWIVPIVSKRSQRSGDMVAGTVVVSDRPQKIDDLSLAWTAGHADVRFRFDATTLKRLRPQDVEVVRKILERWSVLKPAERSNLLEKIVPSLVSRLQVESPSSEDYQQFLGDLYAAELRRQHRDLG